MKKDGQYGMGSSDRGVGGDNLARGEDPAFYLASPQERSIAVGEKISPSEGLKGGANCGESKGIPSAPSERGRLWLAHLSD